MAKEYRSARHVARLWERLPLDGLTLVSFEAAAIFQILHLIDASRLRSFELIDTSSRSVELVASTPNVGPLRELVVRGITDGDNLAEVMRLAEQRLGKIIVMATRDDPWPWRYYQ
jgi:hypothetical protein